MDFVVAIDGPAASGKGTLARRLGAAFLLPVLDTGRLYRAVGAALIRRGDDPDDETAAATAARALDLAAIADMDLEGGAVGEIASRVAVHPAVRDALRQLQRDFALQPGGAVLDGRDIGTVIAPEAPAKLFVTASSEARAQRRWAQLTARGDVVSLTEILADIRRRDERDGARAAAPLTRAADAVLLDTTHMDIDAAFDAAQRIVQAARGRPFRSADR